jgi:hypothetical protein
MLVRLCVALCLEILCSAECVSYGKAEDGRVVIEALTAFGEPIENAHIELLQRGSRKSFTSAFRGNVAAHIPYGSYDARIEAPGFVGVEREIRVYQSETSVRVDLRVGSECGGYASLQGTIEPAPRHRRLWAKFVPVRGSDGVEAPVAPDGKFSVAGLDDGSYLVIVLDDTSIIHIQTVEVFGSKMLTVHLTPHQM